MRSIGNIIVRYHLAPGHMIWWFNLTKWFDIAKTSDEAVYRTGFLVSMKMLPILADLVIAAVIYLIAKTQKIIKHPLLWASIYLFSPFSWYLSSIWGQYDQLSYLPVLLAFILESKKKYPVITPFLLALSIAIKPTSLILVPLFAYLYLKNKHQKKEITLSIILVVIFFLETIQVFTKGNPLEFLPVLQTKIFEKGSSRLSANAFNFWRIFQLRSTDGADFKFLFIPAYLWSYLAFIFFNILGIRKLQKVDTRNVLTAVFIISAGSFIFMTGMLDRYFFAGVVTGLILCIYNPKYLKFWIPISLIFLINLYNQWWFPEFLHPLYLLMTWQNGLITKLLSLLNVLFFVKWLRKL